MNHLVFLDTRAGELEKILRGMKTMLIRESDPTETTAQAVRAGDSLYFTRNQDDFAVRVRATVVRVLYSADSLDEDLSQTLKELQPKLQLTESQYNYWSARRPLLLVEFGAAHKTDVIHIAAHKIADRSGWMAFEDLGLIAE